MSDGSEIVSSERSELGVTSTRHSDGVVHVVFDRGVVVDERVQKASRETQEAVTAGSAYVAVADVRGIAYFDQTARSLSSTDPRRRQLALAVIVGPRITRFVVERAFADYAFDRPVAIFFDPNEAIGWAREKVSQFREQGLIP